MYKKLTATLFKKAVPARYDHINFTPPKGVREEAKRGLKLRREHKRGGLSTQQASKHGIGSGVQRATNLASGASVSPRTVRRMRAFFARHSAYKEHHKDKTSASYISWLLWGGDAGERWANKVYAQMERADDEMKKAGGEQAGHKYIRRIPVARRGKMGYRYIYRRDKRKNLRRKDGEQKTSSVEADSSTRQAPLDSEIKVVAEQMGLGELDRSSFIDLMAEHAGSMVPELQGLSLTSRLTQEQFGQFMDLLDDDLENQILDTMLEKYSSYAQNAPTDDASAFTPLPDLDPNDENHEWGAPYVDALNEAPQVHAPTFEGVSTAPVEFNETPVEDAPTEELSTFIEALGETEGLGPVGDAVKNTTSVEGDELRLPLKDIGKATALSLMLLATESYRTLTTNDPNAVSVAEVEGFSKRELNKMDREAVQEAKAKIRESLNKDREEARAKNEERKKVEREIKEKLRNEARKQKEEKRTQEKQQREEAKQQREEERAQEKQQRERDRAEKERLKQTQKQQREQENKEDTARKEEEAKKQAEKEFEFRREERERAQEAREEAQVRKEQRAEERKAKLQEAKDKKATERKEAKAERDKKAKEAKAERDKKAKEAKANKAEEKKRKDVARKKLAEEKKAKQKADIAERKKQAQEQKAKLRAQEREHKEKLKRETAEHKEKLKRETAEHKEKLAKERAEQREKLKKVPKKVPKKQTKPAESKPAEKKPAEKKERTRPPRAKKRKARKRKLRKSLVTMYTGRGSDETTS